MAKCNALCFLLESTLLQINNHDDEKCYCFPSQNDTWDVPVIMVGRIKLPQYSRAKNEENK